MGSQKYTLPVGVKEELFNVHYNARTSEFLYSILVSDSFFSVNYCVKSTVEAFHVRK